MPYLTQDSEILAFVAQSTKATTLWMDTEVADYQSRNPRLSLIQVLNDPTDLSGESIYLLDVLDNNHIITEFINQIMINPGIEKVFHNSSYDLKFLGSKKAKNITCTKLSIKNFSCSIM
jgi:ribonuclease D